MGLERLEQAIIGSRFFEVDLLERLRKVPERVEETSTNPDPRRRTPKGSYDVLETLLIEGGLITAIEGSLFLTGEGQEALGA